MNANADRYNFWLLQYRDQQQSGLSILDFCRSRGLKSGTYRQAIARYGFTDSSPNQKEPQRNFIELTGAASQQNCVLEIEYRGFQVRLFPGVDSAVIRNTLEALEGIQ